MAKKDTLETPQFIKDLIRAGKITAGGLGTVGSFLYDPVAAATEYVTGIKTPRLLPYSHKYLSEALGLPGEAAIRKSATKVSPPVKQPATAAPVAIEPAAGAPAENVPAVPATTTEPVSTKPFKGEGFKSRGLGTYTNEDIYKFFGERTVPEATATTELPSFSSLTPKTPIPEAPDISDYEKRSAGRFETIRKLLEDGARDAGSLFSRIRKQGRAKLKAAEILAGAMGYEATGQQAKGLPNIYGSQLQFQTGREELPVKAMKARAEIEDIGIKRALLPSEVKAKEAEAGYKTGVTKGLPPSWGENLKAQKEIAALQHQGKLPTDFYLEYTKQKSDINKQGLPEADRVRAIAELDQTFEALIPGISKMGTQATGREKLSY